MLEVYIFGHFDAHYIILYRDKSFHISFFTCHFVHRIVLAYFKGLRGYRLSLLFSLLSSLQFCVGGCFFYSVDYVVSLQSDPFHNFVNVVCPSRANTFIYLQPEVMQVLKLQFAFTQLKSPECSIFKNQTNLKLFKMVFYIVRDHPFDTTANYHNF